MPSGTKLSKGIHPGHITMQFNSDFSVLFTLKYKHHGLKVAVDVDKSAPNPVMEFEPDAYFFS